MQEACGQGRPFRKYHAVCSPVFAARSCPIEVKQELLKDLAMSPLQAPNLLLQTLRRGVSYSASTPLVASYIAAQLLVVLPPPALKMEDEFAVVIASV